ncbi:MAG: bifunctional transaldolase/phosoglucose isomerase, partial [Pyrinomonadaceae bacterium]
MMTQDFSFLLPDIISRSVRESLADWNADQKLEKLWAGDESLWTSSGESKWLGWLSIIDQQLARIDEIERVAREVKAQEISDVVLLGMGGSSLCPEVMKLVFGKQSGFPQLHVLDSTDPAQIRNLEK